MSVPDGELLPDSRSSRTPRDVLRLYQHAIFRRSADDLAELYAVDAVHEFSFSTEGREDRCEGRDAVRASYLATWSRELIELESIEESFAYQPGDPEVVVGQWHLHGRHVVTGARVTTTGLLFLQVRSGYIVHARDFLDGIEPAPASTGKASSVAVPATTTGAMTPASRVA